MHHFRIQCTMMDSLNFVEIIARCSSHFIHSKCIFLEWSWRSSDSRKLAIHAILGSHLSIIDTAFENISKYSSPATLFPMMLFLFKKFALSLLVFAKNTRWHASHPSMLSIFLHSILANSPAESIRVHTCNGEYFCPLFVRCWWGSSSN